MCYDKSTEFVYIYVLWDPRTNEIRYVGKATDPEYRFSKHLVIARSKSKPKQSHLKNWLQKLNRMGIQPTLDVVEMVPESRWIEKECWWIAFLKENGVRLVNGTLGGDGVNMTPEIRKKVSDSKRGKPGHKHTPETIQKISAKQKGVKRKPLTDEHKAKISKAGKGKKRSLETRERIRMGKLLLGPMQTEASKKKIGDASRGRKMSPESSAKKSVALLGHKHTEESKILMSQKMNERFADPIRREQMLEKSKKTRELNGNKKPPWTEERRERQARTIMKKKLEKENNIL